MERLFPDPVLTANVYCTGGLDAVLYQGVAPFWEEVQARDPERQCYLWVMRYRRGGEHLKVRVHGPEELRPLQRQLLESRIRACLEALPAPVPAGESPGMPPPAIDAEDQVEGDHPDRTLLWTTYGRSLISFGGQPFLADDRYAALFTRSLAAGCELALQGHRGEGDPPSYPKRQSTLLKALRAGADALPFSPAERIAYHAYHRDWLLRTTLPRERRGETEALEQLGRLFDQQIERQGLSLAAFRPRRGEVAGEGPEASWGQALVRLWQHVLPFCTDPDYQLDPFASHAGYPPVFKVFHGLANQLGIKMTDEAFLHHLLGRAAQDG